MFVSIVGYANSGKTTFCVALVNAACREGLRVAVLKTGRLHRASVDDGDRDSDDDGPVPRAPDSEAAFAAGAEISVFWSDAGLEVITAHAVTHESQPALPDRETFARRWTDLLPASIVDDLRSCDLVVVEGRVVDGAVVIQVRRSATFPQEEDTDVPPTATGRAPDGDYKYPPKPGHILVPDERAVMATVDRLVRMLRVPSHEKKRSGRTEKE